MDEDTILLLVHNASLILLRDCLGDCSDVARLEKLRKQAERIILDCHYMTPSKDMFSELRWLPLNDWVKYRKATLIYKAINGKAPDYISAMFR